MSDPRRVSLEPSSDLERTLLAAARARAPVGARQRAVLAATAAVAASGLATGTATAGSALAKAGSAIAAHWITVAGVVGIGAVTTAVVIGQPRTPAPTQPADPRATPTAAPTVSSAPGSALSMALPLPAPSSAPEASAPVSAPRTASPPMTTASSVAAELAALQQARSALASGDPARALSILDEYATEFPRASMAPEATMLRIESLVAAGDRDAARRAADAFLATHPASPYATRIHSLLDTNR